MRGFLLDTNVRSELTRPQSHPRVEKWLRDADDGQLHLSVISIGEIFKGIEILPESKRRRQLQEWVEDKLRPWFEGRIPPVTEAVAKRWGILEGECQTKGTPVRVADGLIAATALVHGLTVVTRNMRDFRRLGVHLIDPWHA